MQNLTNEVQYFKPGKVLRLRNVICPYCGIALTADNQTKEHVVGRGFVPTGALNGQWNLILNACIACNVRKSDLEDDISAITMQPDVQGQYASAHAQLIHDARKKAKGSRSRYTRKLVGESRSTMEIDYELASGVTMKFSMVGQAQIAEERAFELALRHFQGFFYFITYNHTANRGWWWRGNYAPIQIVSKRDWGNELACAFMEHTRDWDHRVLAITADEHFKLVIRKHLSVDVWSLAVEWNENHRVFATCGDPEALTGFLSQLPKLQAQTVYRSPERTIWSRIEKSLPPDQDILFANIPRPS